MKKVNLWFPMIVNPKLNPKLEGPAARIMGLSYSQRVHIHYYYGIRPEKTIPIMVWGGLIP